MYVGILSIYLSIQPSIYLSIYLAIAESTFESPEPFWLGREKEMRTTAKEWTTAPLMPEVLRFPAKSATTTATTTATPTTENSSHNEAGKWMLHDVFHNGIMDVRPSVVLVCCCPARTSSMLENRYLSWKIISPARQHRPTNHLLTKPASSIPARACTFLSAALNGWPTRPINDLMFAFLPFPSKTSETQKKLRKVDCSNVQL